MRVTRLTVKNIGIIEDAEIPIDKPEIIFYGEIKQGKSTLLNSVRWACGGAFPNDILRHGQTEGFVQIEGVEQDGKPWVLRREWYRGKDGTTKSREVIYSRNGVPVKKPVAEIQKHLNPFLLDQDHLRKMTPLERSRYLVELFGVDTSAEDAVIAEADRQASQLRIKVKMYGAIDLTPVERVDVQQLQAQRREVEQQHAAKVQVAKDAMQRAELAYRTACDDVRASNATIRSDNAEVDRIAVGVASRAEQIVSLRKQLEALEKQHADGEAWLKTHARRDEKPLPESPDVSEHQTIAQSVPDTRQIDAALSKSEAQNVRAEAYETAKKRAAERAADEKALAQHEKVARDAKAEKVNKLASVGNSTGIAGLVFTDAGFTFDGTDASMLSDSQVMRLSEALSGKYPEGFGLSMIDRGESLGKSVLTLWEEAKAREATVLVTVVGDKPAVVPEEVGAYVVDNGRVQG